jgi:hypothetical protein
MGAIISKNKIISKASSLNDATENEEQFDCFRMLPPDIQTTVWGYWGLKDQSTLASSSLAYRGFFSAELMTAKLLMLVAHGMQTRAQAILVQYRPFRTLFKRIFI